jgi:hypothetical protein
MIGMYLIHIGTYEKFRMMFDIPCERSLVIKNGVDNIKPRDIHKVDKEIKLIFHPTPWRGLNVILAAMQMIQNKSSIIRCIFFL